MAMPSPWTAPKVGKEYAPAKQSALDILQLLRRPSAAALCAYRTGRAKRSGLAARFGFEHWQADRRMALLRLRGRNSAYSVFHPKGVLMDRTISLERAMGANFDAIQRRSPEK